MSNRLVFGAAARARSSLVQSHVALTARPFVTTPLVRQEQRGTAPQQALKDTKHPETGKPANPSPPPRANASSPQPGAAPLQSTRASDYSGRPTTPVTPRVWKTSWLGSIRMGIKRWLRGNKDMKSKAVSATFTMYDRCAQRWDQDAEYWQGELRLPPTYQSWFSVTNMHVALLLVRFRDLPPSVAAEYTQQLINHFFVDAHYRMNLRFDAQTRRLVKGYMKDMHSQQRGFQAAIDESLGMMGYDGQGDSRLAQTLWRNVFGAGWGNVGGVVYKSNKPMKDKPVPTGMITEGSGKVAEGRVPVNPYQHAVQTYKPGNVEPQFDPSDPMAISHPELAFPINLSRLTRWFMRELRRLAAISDAEIIAGVLSRHPGPAEENAPPQHIDPFHVASVGAGETVERQVTRPLDMHVQAERNREGQEQVTSEGDVKSVAHFSSPRTA